MIMPAIPSHCSETSEPHNEISIGRSNNRVVTRLPPDAVALEFSSPELVRRHAEIVEYGASWDYPEYRPHITFCYGGEIDVKTVVPYGEPLEFGPEIWRQTRDGKRRPGVNAGSKRGQSG